MLGRWTARAAPLALALALALVFVLASPAAAAAAGPNAEGQLRQAHRRLVSAIRVGDWAGVRSLLTSVGVPQAQVQGAHTAFIDHESGLRGAGIELLKETILSAEYTVQGRHRVAKVAVRSRYRHPLVAGGVTERVHERIAVLSDGGRWQFSSLACSPDTQLRAINTSP
jgi:hypothetical protein